jgi:DNA-binding response OmpR family regulator
MPKYIRSLDRLALALQQDRWTSSAELVNELWGDRSDGGPTQARKNIHLYIHRLRCQGMRIETWYNNGYRLAQDHFGP